MYEEKYISKDRLDEALNHPVVINTSMLGLKRDYFTDWIYEQVNSYVSGDLKHDLIVKTTLDSRVQNVASGALNTQLDEVSVERKIGQGATVVLDRSGRILGMIGGRRNKNDYFNRATQALRQAGSAFKVFVYATALEHGMNVEDQIEDKPISFGKWSPKNFNKNFLGLITLQEAFSKSINTISVRLTNKLGVKNVIETAKRMGINSPIEPNLSIALGTSSVTLLELTSAVGSIANRGYLVTPYAINSVIDNTNGQLLYHYQAPEPQVALSEDVVSKMTVLLEATVNSGTGRNVAVPQFQVWGKTGTSQDFRDAWFVGYTNKYLIGVWLGNDDYTPTKYVSGGTYPAIIAKKILKNIQ